MMWMIMVTCNNNEPYVLRTYGLCIIKRWLNYDVDDHGDLLYGTISSRDLWLVCNKSKVEP